MPFWYLGTFYSWVNCGHKEERSEISFVWILLWKLKSEVSILWNWWQLTEIQLKIVQLKVTDEDIRSNFSDSVSWSNASAKDSSWLLRLTTPVICILRSHLWMSTYIVLSGRGLISPCLQPSELACCCCRLLAEDSSSWGEGKALGSTGRSRQDKYTCLHQCLSLSGPKAGRWWVRGCCSWRGFAP